MPPMTRQFAHRGPEREARLDGRPSGKMTDFAPRFLAVCQGRNRMDANRAVESGIFFRWIFFEKFAENSSFSFAPLDLLRLNLLP
jgi:hypothetical protein